MFIVEKLKNKLGRREKNHQLAKHYEHFGECFHAFVLC